MTAENNEISFDWEEKSEDTIFVHHVIGILLIISLFF